MIPLVWMLLWGLLALLAIFAGAAVHARRRQQLESERSFVDDEAIDAILTKGKLFVEDDEPLDQAEIDHQERRFWSESWDEPEDW